MCIVPKFIIDWFIILVSLVLKLFVSSRPLKLEGVLCIYVLLLHEGQAKNHFLCFSIWLKHTRDFHCFIFIIYRLCSFSCYNMVAKFLISRLYLSCPCFKFFWSQHSMLTYMVKIVLVHVTSKIILCYHLPTRGQAGVKLGDAWYVSNVSIIFDATCLFIHHLLSVLLHFVVFLCIFRN
jgi:hypothetical protein